MMNNERIRIALKGAGAVIAIVLAAKLFLPDVTSPGFRNLIEEAGIWGPLAVIGYIITAHVIAPLLGSPIVFLAIAVFGIVETMTYLYLASMISSVMNFCISRKFGRIWVRKLAGEKNMEEMNRFLGVSGVGVFVAARIFGFALFDIISYAAGFTRISFKKYFLITAGCALIPFTVIAILFRNFDFTSEYNFIIWTSTIFLAGTIFAFLLRKKLSKRLEHESRV